MKRFFSILVVLASINSYGQQIQWFKEITLNGADDKSFVGIEIDDSNNLFISGTARYANAPSIISSDLYRINDAGDVLFHQQDTARNSISINTIQIYNQTLLLSGSKGLRKVDLNGNLIYQNVNLTSERMKFFNNATYLIENDSLFKFDTNGNEVWKKGIGPSVIRPNIAVENNHVYVNYESYNPAGYILNKYDTLGNLSWSVPSYSREMVLDEQGHCYMIGNGVTKISPTGNSEWVINSDSLSLYNATVSDDTLYLVGCTITSNPDDRQSSLTKYTLQGDYISTVLFNFSPIVERITHVLKNENDIYLGGITGSEFSKAFLAKVSLSSATGIEKKEKLDYVIYPNPGTGKFTIKGIDSNTLGEGQIKVANSLGLNIYRNNFEMNSSTFQVNIDLSSQPKGIYFMEISNKNTIESRKVVIQ